MNDEQPDTQDRAIYVPTEKGRAAVAAYRAELDATSDSELRARCERDVIRARARGGLDAVRGLVELVDLLATVKELDRGHLALRAAAVRTLELAGG